MDTQIVRLDEVPPFAMGAGVVGRPLFGEKGMLNHAEMAPRSSVPDHSHPHEQIGYILSGRVFLRVEGAEHELTAGDAFAIPPGVVHGSRTEDDAAVFLDVFVPVREDYRNRPTEE